MQILVQEMGFTLDLDFVVELATLFDSLGREVPKVRCGNALPFTPLVASSALVCAHSVLNLTWITCILKALCTAVNAFAICVFVCVERADS